MNDQLITFETAKLAKEKGFNGKCRAKIHCSHYHLVIDNIMPENVPTSENEMFAPLNDWNNHEEHDRYRKQTILKGLNTSLPTQSLLQKWLREVHKINIESNYLPNVKKYRCLFIPMTLKKPSEYSTPGTAFTSRFNYLGKENYNTYEEALEVGLYQALLLL